MLIGILAVLTSALLFAAGPKIPDSPKPTWTAAVGMHPMYRYQPPLMYHGRLYFIAHNDFRNHIYFLDGKNGAVLWTSPFRATRMDLYSDDSLRVFTLDRYYLGLHAHTGQAFDSNDLLNQPNIYETSYSPLYADGLTLVTAKSGEFTALAPAGEKWKVPTGWGFDVSLTPPIGYKDLVILGAGQSTERHPGGLKAYSVRTGAVAWTAPDVRDATSIKLHGDVVLVHEAFRANSGQVIFAVRAIDAATGKQLWTDTGMAGSLGQNDTMGWEVDKSQSDGQMLIVPSGAADREQFTLHVVDLHTGAAKFTFPLTSVKFTLSQGVVYAVQGKQVAAIDPLNGAVLWQSAPFAGSPYTPVAGDGFVYAGDRQSVSAWAVR